jgi:hypothetical protein
LVKQTLLISFERGSILCFMRRVLVLFLGIVCWLPISAAPARQVVYEVGIAVRDVTPDYPVRLAGYAARSTECTNVAQRIHAKALVIGTDRDQPKVLLTVDNCGVPNNVREEVVAALKREKRILPSNVTICSSHTHSAPLLHGYLTNLFIGLLPPDQDAHIKRYTKELTYALVEVAKEALSKRAKARLSFGKGAAGFAANRRTPGGPVDHDVPVLAVHSPKGELRAVVASYACHCTTLTGEFNAICGDWAGFAQARVESEHPGATCLVAIGCGGDANPNPRPGMDLAEKHGDEIAKAVKTVLSGSLKSVTGELNASVEGIRLAYVTLPTRTEWEAKAKDTPYVAQHARLNLARLDRGEKLPTHLPYMVQTWNFGNSLAFVFLPGEVTVDYSLRLKREFDSTRVWVVAYANDVPCYVPSERVLKEGGYEGGYAMVYYDRPAPFAPGVEDTIVSAVHRLMPMDFLAGWAAK